jgi:uncharacterized membrane protein YqjE
MRDTTQAGGLFASLSRMLATVLQIAQVRLQLLGTELELEKRRVFDGLLWGGLALVVLGLGLVLLCGFVILLFWEGYRLAAVGGMTLFLLTGGGLMLNHARMRLQNRSSSKSMFDASLAELKRDQADLTAAAQDAGR